MGAGIRPEIDLAQARTAVSNARVQLVTANNNRAVALAQLEQAMGLPEHVDYELADSALSPVAGEDGPLQNLVVNAVSVRPEIATIQKQRRAQELTVSSLRGAYGPSLNAIGSFTDGGTQISNMVANWFVGLSLNWNILQGGLTKGQVHEANATLAALDAQEDNLRLTVRVEVEQAQLGVRAAKETISASRDALVNARDQLRLAEARYAQGLGSVIELGDAQVAVTAAAAQRQIAGAVQSIGGTGTAHVRLGAGMSTKSRADRRADQRNDHDRSPEPAQDSLRDPTHETGPQPAALTPPPAPSRSSRTAWTIAIVILLAARGRIRHAPALAVEDRGRDRGNGRWRRRLGERRTRCRAAPIARSRSGRAERSGATCRSRPGPRHRHRVQDCQHPLAGQRPPGQRRLQEGQPVKNGDVLAQIDPRPFTIVLHPAEAAPRARRGAAVGREANLNARVSVAQRLIPQQQVDDQRALVDQLRGRSRPTQAQIVETARLQLIYARITSPIDGVTGVRLVDPATWCTHDRRDRHRRRRADGSDRRPVHPAAGCVARRVARTGEGTAAGRGAQP